MELGKRQEVLVVYNRTRRFRIAHGTTTSDLLQALKLERLSLGVDKRRQWDMPFGF